MSDYNAGERRIVNTDRLTNTMPLFGIPWADGYVPIAFGLLATLAGSLIGLAGLSALLAGGLLVYLSPSAVTTSTWVKDIWGYVLRPSRIYSASADAPSDARNEGGLLNRTPFAPDTRTEDYTGITRAWPGTGVVLRSDRRIETAIEITAPNMDFATTVDWEVRQKQGKKAANDVLVGYPETKLHITTEPFDIQEIIDDLEDRLTDDDIQHRDVLRELVTEYKNHRPQDLQDRGTQRIRLYLIVTVDPSEATTEYLGEPTPKEKLAQVPLLGLLAPASWSGGVNQTRAEMHANMAETAEDRVDQVREELFKDMEGYSVRRLSTIELFTLGARFWNGHDTAYNEVERVVRQTPVSRAASDVDGVSQTRQQSAYTDGGTSR